MSRPLLQAGLKLCVQAVCYVCMYIWYSFDLSLAPNVNSTSTANTIFATWNRDENAVRYDASLSRPYNFNMSQGTNGTDVAFGGLVPATTYTLTVEGVDTQNRSGDPAIVNITTNRTCELESALHADECACQCVLVFQVLLNCSKWSVWICYIKL